MEAQPWCLVLGAEIYLIQKNSRLATKISQKNKKNWIFVYVLTLHLFFC